jgi:hypothetical protein
MREIPRMIFLKKIIDKILLLINKMNLIALLIIIAIIILCVCAYRNHEGIRGRGRGGWRGRGRRGWGRGRRGWGGRWGRRGLGRGGIWPGYTWAYPAYYNYVVNDDVCEEIQMKRYRECLTSGIDEGECAKQLAKNMTEVCGN